LFQDSYPAPFQLLQLHALVFPYAPGNFRYPWELNPHSRGGIAISKYSLDFAYTAQITVDTFFHYLYHPSQPEEFDFAGTDDRTRFRKGREEQFVNLGKKGLKSHSPAGHAEETQQMKAVILSILTKLKTEMAPGQKVLS
jgi:hypothetical protein